MTQNYQISMKRAHSELRTLYQDGWVFMHQTMIGVTIYIHLRHPRNHSRLVLEVCPRALYWHRDGKLKKAEFYE